MKFMIRFPSGGMSLAALAIVWFGFALSGQSAAAGLPALSLPEVKLEVFGEIPPLKALKVKPELKDSATSLDQAANARAVLKFLGVNLSSDDKKFLDENKFLLIPRRATKFKGKLSGMVGV